MDEKWKQLLKRMDENHEIGEEIYQMLSQSCKNGTEILVCPMHIGDTVLIASMAQDYKKQHQIEKLLVVSYTVPPETLEQFPGVDAALQLEEIQMYALQFYMTVHDLMYANGIRYAYHRHILQISNVSFYYTILLDQRLSLSELMRGILDLTLEAKMRCMKVNQDRLEQYKNTYSGSVMLMPGTITEKKLPLTFWEKLGGSIKQKGYQVYTNYNGKECEAMVEGTIPLSSTLTEMTAMAQAFRLFIGVRSGGCDLVALAGARLAVVFSQQSGESTLEATAENRPNGWQGDIVGASEIWNYVYIPEREEELIERICDALPKRRIGEY